MADDLIATTEIPQRTPRQKKVLRQRIVLVLSFAVVVAAWVYGYFTNGIDVLPLVSEVLPDAARIESQGKLFVGYDKAGEVVGYAATGVAPGYAGPIQSISNDRQLLFSVRKTGELTENS